MALRSPICAVVGHVDHGKSSILDYVRGTNIVAKEAGAITQAIGASIIPIEVLKKLCGKLLAATKTEVNIPGLLFIDTPGHAAFTSMRERGSSLADIAVLVVDINEGLKPQTMEAIQILRDHKTPFVIAANKIDLIQGYQSNPKSALLANIGQQSPQVQTTVDNKMYELVGKFYEQGLKAERFDRVSDFTQELAIIPVSALKGDGMPELLMVVTALAQKFLEKSLALHISGPAKGTILEVKDQKGLGKVMDAIIYDGILKVNDTIIVGHVDGHIEAKVRALFTTVSHEDMRDSRAKFKGSKEVVAATGVRIAAPGSEGVISGMPFEAVHKDEDKQEAIERIQESVKGVQLDSQKEGVYIKADTLGGLEALMVLLKENDIPVRRAAVGAISKKDMIDAKAEEEINPLYAAILGFNISKLEGDDSVPQFCAPVIYQIIDEYIAWKEAKEKSMQEESLQELPRACKFEFMKNHTFRQSHPAIIGVTIEAGVLKKGMSVMKQGQRVGLVKNVQLNNASVEQAVKNDQVAVSIEGVTVGRQIDEGDVLFSAIDEEEFRLLKEQKELISTEEKEVLRQIASIMREDNPVWGL